ncbi:MAG: aspartyl/glutamyl-tRNA amidotransferase subunit C [Spirochaetaceae bacterium]|jgi:Asp-tRNA(Asn)/Glu-tRNA(Gln) amidotransferase C subunit|nr:aspartyl/glutamyl-tRNA amidotransferase subunit C [Spirochaetaceae bacterium]
MDIEELKITANLARLNMSDEELRDAYCAFEQMLEYFSAMQDAGHLIDGLDGETADVLSAAPDLFRTDAEVSAGAVEPEAIIEKAAEHDGHFIVIPNVL